MRKRPTKRLFFFFFFSQIFGHRIAVILGRNNFSMIVQNDIVITVFLEDRMANLDITYQTQETVFHVIH